MFKLKNLFFPRNKFSHAILLIVDRAGGDMVFIAILDAVSRPASLGPFAKTYNTVSRMEDRGLLSVEVKLIPGHPDKARKHYSLSKAGEELLAELNGY